MKTEPIHIRPGLSLYKQPLTGKGGSRFWYARVRMKIGGRDLHAKSTGTTDEAAAKRFADSYFGECLLRCRYPDLVEVSGNPSNPTHRFDVVADQWLDQRKAMAGSDRRKLRGWDDARKLVIAPNGLGTFFKRTDIATITTDRVRDYLQFAADHSTKGELAPTTQRNHLSILSAILKFATERRLISAVPPMPKLRLKDNPRPCFNDIEFIELCAFARVLTRRAEYDGDHALAADRAELQGFLTFMLATFLRAGEWKEIRQKHCRVVYGPSPYLEVSVPNGKTHKRRVVSMPEAIPVWDRIIERDGQDPERFIFLDRYQNRETAQERMRDRFEEALNAAGLALDEFGHKRTVYSLRHTALMFRLLNGDHVDLLMLARNAGTSVDQLERFYLSHADPAMKVENLHSSRFPREFEEMVDEEPEGISHEIQLQASLDEPAFEPVAG